MKSDWIRKTARWRAAALLSMVAVAVALVASAQATTSTKNFDAFVVPTSAPNVTAATAAFKLTLTNETASQQTLGSANFTAPAGWTVTAVGPADRANWDLCAGDGTTCGAAASTVQFRAHANADALPPGASVSTNVTAQYTCPTGQTAAWSVQAKQSNDFSGQPGNGFLPGSTDLNPLGSFAFTTIGTQTLSGSPPTTTFGVSATARDTCGALKGNYTGGAPYGGSALTASSGLTSGTVGPFSWQTNSASITARTAESGNTLTLRDTGSGIATPSNAFSVVNTLCQPTPGNKCQAKSADTFITVDSPTPPAGATLGLGINDKKAATICGGRTVIDGIVVLVDPHGYGNGPVTVTFTYDKALTGGASAASFFVCLQDAATKPIPVQLQACPSATDTECIVSQKRIGSGALQVVLRLDQNDPYGGLS